MATNQSHRNRLAEGFGESQQLSSPIVLPHEARAAARRPFAESRPGFPTQRWEQSRAAAPSKYADNSCSGISDESLRG